MEAFTVENLSFTYAGSSAPALSGVSFSVEEGEFCVICGESGSGKTTLLKLFKPVISPNGSKSGRILYRGRPVEEVPRAETAFKIGYVSQLPETQTVTDTVMHELAFTLENMGLPSDEIEIRISETAAYFGLSDVIEKPVSELSGGQIQLLNLASVSAAAPDALILDEPLSRLDPVSVEKLTSVINKLNRELSITVIMSEHRLEGLFPLADKFVALSGGKLLGASSVFELPSLVKGTPSELALPSAVKMKNALCPEEACPLSLRDGRRLFKKYSGAADPVPEEERPVFGEPILKIKNAYFRYGKNSPDVIKSLSLTVGRGEILSIVGANGSGKTTLLSLISGAIKPYRGKIRCESRTALMPQDPKYLFVKDTLREDFLTVGAEEDMLRLCDKFEMTPLLSRHPFDLSGGELQRAAFVKLLLLKPELLLLDEPTKGCDAFSKRELKSLLTDLGKSGTAVILVTHDIDFSACVSQSCSLLFCGGLSEPESPRRFFSDKSFYTTSANRLSRGIWDGIVTEEELISICEKIRGGRDV